MSVNQRTTWKDSNEPDQMISVAEEAMRLRGYFCFKVPFTSWRLRPRSCADTDSSTSSWPRWKSNSCPVENPCYGCVSSLPRAAFLFKVASWFRIIPHIRCNNRALRFGTHQWHLLKSLWIGQFHIWFLVLVAVKSHRDIAATRYWDRNVPKWITFD